MGNGERQCMSSGSRSRTITAEHEVECVRELEARSFRS